MAYVLLAIGCCCCFCLAISPFGFNNVIERVAGQAPKFMTKLLTWSLCARAIESATRQRSTCRAQENNLAKNMRSLPYKLCTHNNNTRDARRYCLSDLPTNAALATTSAPKEKIDNNNENISNNSNIENRHYSPLGLLFYCILSFGLLFAMTTTDKLEHLGRNAE